MWLGGDRELVAGGRCHEQRASSSSGSGSSSGSASRVSAGCGSSEGLQEGLSAGRGHGSVQLVRAAKGLAYLGRIAARLSATKVFHGDDGGERRSVRRIAGGRSSDLLAALRQAARADGTEHHDSFGWRRRIAKLG